MIERRRPILALAAPLILSACAANPLSYYTGSASRSADIVQTLAWGYTGVMVIVVVAIAALIGVGIARSRRRAVRSDSRIVGRENGGLSMIYWGLGISMPVIIALAVWNFVATRAIANPDRPTELTIEVTGHRWWWEIRYHDPELPQGIVTTANELVIPTGMPVRLEFKSADVIHDFWVPKLGPKMDMIPGKTNISWIEARDAGSYRGQCAEYCGLEHADMGFVVKAVAPAAFADWLNAERRPAAPHSGDRGQDLFVRNCAACHSVRGIGAGGIYGPDLTHFAARETIAAGLLRNTPANQTRWLAATQQLKPGAMMPTVPLNLADRAAVVDYLGSLQ